MEWLDFERDIFLCKYDDELEQWYSAGKSIVDLIYDYFEVDVNALEAERREMLDILRKMNTK
jgi:hypothetical protein